MFSASSGYRHRPAILRCVKKNMGNLMLTHVTKQWGQNLDTKTFLRRLLGARAVLALPGLGYDCWRIWESLLAGSMPILERGAGLDRSLYKLPALLLDDYAYLTPEVVRQAYVEALYRADEWDYTRMTESYWQRLIFEASLKGNIDHLMRLHPMEAVDMSFTRPLVPFDCDAMGGCGVGTKRVPKKYCAVDPKIDWVNYDWRWFENRRRRDDQKKFEVF